MKNGINKTSFLVEVILVIILFFFLVMSIFENVFFPLCEGIMAVLMFLLAYNNYKTFKRKHYSTLCIVVGIILVISALGRLI